MGVLGYAVLGHTVLGQPEITIGGTSLVTTAELAAHLGNPAGATTGALQILLEDVQSILESETGRPLAVRDITQTTTDADVGVMALDAVPCPCSTCAPHVTFSVTSVTSNGVILALGVTWRVDGSVITLKPASPTGAISDGVSVTYTAGYATCPPWLRQATLRLAEHLWQKTQQAPHPGLSQVGGGYDEGQPSPLSYLLPYQVSSLIDRHRTLT